MLFSVDHYATTLLYSNVMLKLANWLTCSVSTCPMYELARQSQLQNFLNVGITR